MSPQALTFLSIVLAFVGGGALVHFAWKLSGYGFTEDDVDDAHRRGFAVLDNQLEDIRREVYRHAALEAEAVGKALAPSSIVWKAIVRALMKRAHPMLETPNDGKVPVTLTTRHGTETHRIGPDELRALTGDGPE